MYCLVASHNVETLLLQGTSHLGGWLRFSSWAERHRTTSRPAYLPHWEEKASPSSLSPWNTKSNQREYSHFLTMPGPCEWLPIPPPPTRGQDKSKAYSWKKFPKENFITTFHCTVVRIQVKGWTTAQEPQSLLCVCWKMTRFSAQSRSVLFCECLFSVSFSKAPLS